MRYHENNVTFLNICLDCFFWLTFTPCYLKRGKEWLKMRAHIHIDVNAWKKLGKSWESVSPCSNAPILKGIQLVTTEIKLLPVPLLSKNRFIVSFKLDEISK